MVSFEDISRLFAMDLNQKFCIEIEFRVAGLSEYQNCFMGKMPDEREKNREVYWFGLDEDGRKAYDYDDFSAFSSAPVLAGRSLKDMWDRIELLSIDGCEPEERMKNLPD